MRKLALVIISFLAIALAMSFIPSALALPEILRPSGQLSCLNLVTCDFLEHDDDPDISSITIAATGNNINTEYGVDFPTPSANPNTGAALQEFRAGIEEFDSGQTGIPQARIELWENGALVRAGSNIGIGAYTVISFTWNANELATADGSLVQAKVIGIQSGGGPSVRNSINIGNIEWNADIEEPAVNPLTSSDIALIGIVSWVFPAVIGFAMRNGWLVLLSGIVGLLFGSWIIVELGSGFFPIIPVFLISMFLLVIGAFTMLEDNHG